MSIKNRIFDRLSKIFENKGRKAPIPAILLNNADKRSGLSKINVKSRVLQRESEIYQFDTPHTKMIEIIVEEIMNEIIENGFIEITLPPNSINTIGEGENAGGPVIVRSRNLTFAKGKGVIR